MYKSQLQNMWIMKINEYFQSVVILGTFIFVYQ